MPPNDLAGGKTVHLPFIEGQPLHQVPLYAWEHWLELAAAGLPLLCLPVGCCCMANPRSSSEVRGCCPSYD